MADNTDNNVVDIKQPFRDAGLAQQKYRRKNQQPRKPRKKTAPSSLSETTGTTSGGSNTAETPAAQQTKNDSVSNDMVRTKESTQHVPAAPDNVDIVRDEFRPIRRGGGGGNFRIGSTSHHTALDVLAILSAIGLAAITAWLSINGMVVLFPGLPVIALLLGVAIEGSKITTSAWLGRHWHDAAWISRVALIGFTAMCAMLNAASVYSQLVQAHVGARGQLTATTETRNAEAAGRIEVQQDKVADLDKRLRQIDDAIAEATRRGRTKDALKSIEQQRQARATLSNERDAAARELANLKTRRVETSAQGKAAEVESTPLRYSPRF